MSDGKTNLDLIRRALDGDRNSLELLLLEHYDRLVRRIEPKLSGKLQRLLSVDDILQETFIRAIKDIRKCQATTEGAFAAWLNSLCENQLLDSVRRLQRNKRGGQFRQVERDSAVHSTLDLYDMLVAESHTPDRSVARHEAAYAIQVGIAALPDDQREAVRLNFLHGKTIKETASEMGCTQPAIRGLIQRAKAALQKSLVTSSKWLSKR